MKHRLKIRLAVFLCVMMVLPSIVSILPMMTQEVSAAQELYFDWYYDINECKDSFVEIEKGAKFYVGDYAYITDKDQAGCATLFTKAKYSSSKKGVASVNSKGLLTAKKTGITTIKIKYKGKTISAKFKVVAKGSLSNGAEAKALQKAVNKMKASIPSKVTKGNALKTLKAQNTYSATAGTYSSAISVSGFLFEEVKDGSYTYNKRSNKLAVPQAGRYYYISSLLYQFSDKNSPTSTRSSKALKISSMSANTKQITVKIKNPITVEHILAANIENSYYNKTPNKKSAAVYVSVYDKDTYETYTGLATLKKGAKVLNIKLTKSEWVDDVWTTKTVNLQKGHTYVIGAKDLAWGGGRTVKVK